MNHFQSPRKIRSHVGIKNPVAVLGERRMVVLHQIVDAEADEPAVEEVVVELLQDVLVGVLGWATAHCVGCSVPTYDRPDALDLAARIEGSVPVIGGAISPEADTHLRPLSNRL